MARIHEYLAEEGITSGRVLRAFKTVPRAEFVPESNRAQANGDYPLPIGHGQTISQPYIVAYMTEHLEIRAGDRVLEIGTGSGYQTAILAELTSHVFSVETIEPLSRRAQAVLSRLGYSEIRFSVHNGYHGWPECAPFDRIIVTAAATHVPPALADQLAPDGRMIIPIGPSSAAQELILVRKTAGATVQKRLLPVRFVPFTGEGAARGPV